jgi:hypothetical protein
MSINKESELLKAVCSVIRHNVDLIQLMGSQNAKLPRYILEDTLIQPINDLMKTMVRVPEHRDSQTYDS